MPTTLEQIKDLIGQSSLKGKELKGLLREVVKEHWPDLPAWSTIPHPVIEEVQKATVGVGVVLTFKEHGIQKVVLAEAGDHYSKMKPAGVGASYMIPGGFINLSETPGSSLIAPVPVAEDPRVGGAREVEEELKLPDGTPLLKIDPSRLKPMDTKTLNFPSGEKRVVIGMMLELTPEEVRQVKQHVETCDAEPAYKDTAAQRSINKSSGKPEVSAVAILPLKEVVEGKHHLLHSDQLSLFKIVDEHFKSQGKAASI